VTGKRTQAKKATAFDHTIESAIRSLADADSSITPDETSHREFAAFLKSRRLARHAEALSEVGIASIDDLIFRFPSRYIDARELVPLSKIREHLMHSVSVRGRVISKRLIAGRHRKFATIAIQDDSGGSLQLVFFSAAEWRVKSYFKVDEEYLVAGYPGVYRGAAQIVQPPFIEHLEATRSFVHGQMLPLYYLPDKLRKAGVGEWQFRELIHSAIELGASRIRELLPESLVEREHLMPREDAVLEVHKPESPDRLEFARRRLKYEEVFFLQLRLAVERDRMRKAAKGVISFDVPGISELLSGNRLASQVLASLPYQLTSDQQKSLGEILHDMSKAGGRTYPMNRLLQGDVGSGKTIVALLAMLVAVENGYQCAFMAPTEVLAAQHYDTLSKILKDTYVQTSLLIGGQRKKERQSLLNSIASGETHIVVGTHALIEKNVRFEKLGFVITDEQHRFGVAQRKALIEKGADVPEEGALAGDMFRATGTAKTLTPDVLIMTATPIPRTLALTLYGDMDVSTIRELPKGRKPIKTMLFFEHDHPLIYKAACRRIEERSEQVFIVYPLRVKSEKVDSEAAEKGYEYLRTHDFKDFSVGLIHGKLSSVEKQEAMRKFREREFNVLVATTVIEVGIDVPNATVMIVEHADRFGLAQLHQLRGRVGRGSADSACVLVASEKLAPGAGDAVTGFETSEQLEQASLALERLKILVETSDGFELARADMQIRGTGEILGLKQSGKVILKMANLATDVEIVQQTLRDAEAVIAADPQLRSPENRPTRDEFLRLYRDAESYLHVG
jgi:ATP-dependent DNA helicase RecG